jgi:DNA-directed RNA polymerase subunit delta
MAKSLLDIAYDYISSLDNPCTFNDLWSHIVSEANLSNEESTNKVARFYTNLMLDGRFVFLGDNLWDLRTRQTFAKVHIDMKDAYSDEVVSESNEDENEENYDNDLTETDDDNSENED